MSRRMKLYRPPRYEATPAGRGSSHSDQDGNGPQRAGGAVERKGCGWCAARTPEIGEPVTGWTYRRLAEPFQWGPARLAPCDWFACPDCSADLEVDPPHIGEILARRGGPSTSDRQALTLALVAALGPAVPLTDYAAELPEENQ